MLWTQIVLACLATYIATVALTRSHICGPVRTVFRRLAFWLPAGIRRHFVITAENERVAQLIEPDDDEPANATLHGYDFISCPLCCGFYVAGLMVLLYGLPISCWLPCWGAAYLLDNLAD